MVRMVRIVHARTCCCDDNVSNNNAFFDSNPLPTQGHSYDGEKIASGKLLPWYRPLSPPSSRPPSVLFVVMCMCACFLVSAANRQTILAGQRLLMSNTCT